MTLKPLVAWGGMASFRAQQANEHVNNDGLFQGMDTAFVWCKWPHVNA